MDDDPTGIQTVNGVNVYMQYSTNQLADSMKKEALFFIQTNSRSMTRRETTALHQDIMAKLFDASAQAGKDFTVISRGDSTLRGHYPLETELIREAYERHGHFAVDGEILIPYFKDAGRLTCDDIHYIVDDHGATPVSETEFASDPVFHYKNANLKAYIEEKTAGGCPRESVISISLHSIRSLDFEGIEVLLTSAENYARIIVNALNDNDLKVFCIALRRAENNGKTFLFRTAASFVKIYGGIQNKPLLNGQTIPLNREKHGILVIVGSHVQKTTEQLHGLLTVPGIVPLEINVDALIASDKTFEQAVASAVCNVKAALSAGQNPVVYTSRKLVKAQMSSPSEDNLAISKKVSSALSEIVGRTAHLPGCVISKGGITSSDIAIHGLGIQKAEVLGQILPGVPVIRCTHSQIVQIIFPGNVGGSESLKAAYEILNRTMNEMPSSDQL